MTLVRAAVTVASRTHEVVPAKQCCSSGSTAVSTASRTSTSTGSLVREEVKVPGSEVQRHDLAHMKVLLQFGRDTHSSRPGQFRPGAETGAESRARARRSEGHRRCKAHRAPGQRGRELCAAVPLGSGVVSLQGRQVDIERAVGCY